MSKDVITTVESVDGKMGGYTTERMYTIDEVHTQTWYGIITGLIIGVLLGIGGYGIFVIG